MIYRHTKRVDSIKKRHGRNKLKMKVKCMILISPCCCTSENTATCLKDATTRLSYNSQSPTSHDKRLEMKFQP